MKPHDAAHQSRLNHLIHQLADQDRCNQDLESGPRVLNGENATHKNNGDGTRVGDQGGEADQNSEQHAVGDLQQREHNQLANAEDQRQHHLAGEVTTERPFQSAGDPFPPMFRQPLGQTSGDRISSQQQENGQHQHDHQIDRGADGGTEQSEQTLAELGGHKADPRHQITAEISEIGRQIVRNSPGLALVDPLLSRHKQRRRGTDQLTQLFDQQRHELHRRQGQKSHRDEHHQDDRTGSGQTATHQPSTGKIQQKGDESCR
ncbi:MAG: Uncharacterised protein [Synechococcus sp. CC9902]|nr:MAG: Uncharacterised protein [Synechococcus sp. CC9902]